MCVSTVLVHVYIDFAQTVSESSAMLCCKRRSVTSEAKNQTLHAFLAGAPSDDHISALKNLRLEFGRGFHTLRELKLQCLGLDDALQRWVAFVKWKVRGWQHELRSRTLKYLKANRDAEKERY